MIVGSVYRPMRLVMMKYLISRKKLAAPDPNCRSRADTWCPRKSRRPIRDAEPSSRRVQAKNRLKNSYVTSVDFSHLLAWSYKSPRKSRRPSGGAEPTSRCVQDPDWRNKVSWQQLNIFWLVDRITCYPGGSPMQKSQVRVLFTSNTVLLLQFSFFWSF